MNLLGKCLVVLIFLMCVVFMGLSVAVFETHKNWVEVVNNPRDQATVNRPVGLKYQLEDARTDTAKYAAQLEVLQKATANEKAALEEKIGKLETKSKQLSDDVAIRTSELDKLKVENANQLTALTAAQTTLDEKLKQVDTLRADITAAQSQRDENFKKLVEEQEKFNQASIDLEQLKTANTRLVSQMAQAKTVLERHDLSIDTPLDGVPPKVDGVVLAANAQDGMVEISIGSDDGLRQGNTLEVFRSTKYLGRIQVVRTAPDKSVAKIIPGFQKGRIERDDRVATRLN
jgi:hypothetical protein